MICKLSSFFKRFPNVHKILSWIYNTFILKIHSGYYYRLIKYFLFIYLSEINKLSKYGLCKIKPIKFDGWRWGKGLDKAYRRYYVAYYDQKRCFIKVAKNDATIVNEIKINTYLNSNINELDFTTKLLLSDLNFDSHTAMIVLEFINDLKNFVVLEDVDDFNSVCQSFIRILKEMEKISLVHADVHKGNLMLCNKQLVLLDFGISKVANIENNIDYKARPGTYYREEASQRIYNDAYSFIRMVEELGIEETHKELEAFQYINSLCDDNNMIVNID